MTVPHCSIRDDVEPFLLQELFLSNTSFRGPDSIDGIATGYGLDGLGVKSRWGARFSAPVQTGPGDHPVSCTVGTGSFSGG